MTEAAVAATEKTAAPPSNEDAFAVAFAELSVETPPKKEEEAPPAAAAEKTDEPAPAADEGKDASSTAAAGEEPAGDPEPATPAPTAEADKPAGSDDEVLRRLAELVEKQKTAPKQDKPAPKAADTSAEPEVKAEEDQPLDLNNFYSAEDKKLIEDYQKDWPDVAKAEATLRAGEYKLLLAHIFKTVGAALKPMQERLQFVETDIHHREVVNTVTDYEDVRDKVIEWATSETQPKYLRDAYGRVISEGTPGEIKDLIERWRKETGTTITAQPAPKKDTELPPAAKQAAAALAPVSSKRSAPVKASDPNDFDAAFEEFKAKV